MQPLDPQNDPAARRAQLQVIAGGKPDRCQELASDLALWADDALDDAQAQQVADHVRVCRACAAESRALRETLALLRDADEQSRPARTPGFWLGLEASVLAEVDRQPRVRPWWRRSAWRLGLATALAAAVLGAVAVPVAQWLAQAPAEAEMAGDPVAVFGTASEAVTEDRNFVDDLAATDDDPLGTVDDLDDLDDVDLDALGNAMDDPENGQGA